MEKNETLKATLTLPSTTNGNDKQDDLRRSNGTHKKTALYDCIHDGYINELDSRHKRSIETLEPLSLPSLVDPLEALPQEIWEHIILDIIPDTSSFPTLWHFDQIAELTLVSKKWQRVILSTPRFWNTIQIASDITDLTHKVVTSLALSADLPLRVECESPVTDWPTINLISATHSHRIRSIFVSLHRYDITPVPSVHYNIWRFLDALGDLPLLDELIVNTQDEFTPLLDDIILRTKNIRILDGVETSKTTLTLQPLQNVRRLGTTLRLEDVVEFLPNLKRVESLGFLRQYDPYDKTDVPRLPTVQEIEPLSLVNIEVDLRRPGRIERFLPHVMASLKVIRTSANWSTLPHLLLACANMPHLHTLDFNLLLSTGVTFKPPSGSVAQKLLTLNVQVGSFTGTYPDEQDIKDTSGNIERLFLFLVHWAPNVQDLTIGTVANVGSPWVYATQLSDLKIVRFSFSEDIPSDISEIVLLSVETVLIWTPANIVSSLKCPAALNLQFYLYFGLKENNTFPGDAWQNLRALSIPRTGIDWSGVSLARLENIFLYPIYRIQEETPHSSLLEELARHPSSFPALRKIEDQDVPEWDILFIMLERRNLSSIPGVSLISTLVLPLPPPPFILRPLTDRLRGQISPRPPNAALSLNFLSLGFFDFDLPGCTTCQQSFWDCTVPWMMNYDYIPGGKIDFDPGLSAYPESVEEILDTRERRAYAWWHAVTEFSKKYGSRSSSCDRSVYSNFKEVTGYTLHGSIYESVALFSLEEIVPTDVGQ